MTDPVWQIKSPGVLWLPPTGMEIALALDPHFGKVREIPGHTQWQASSGKMV